MRVKLGISGIFPNEANRGDRQAAPALLMRQRGDLVGGQASDFHHRLAGNTVGQHPLGNAQRLGMLSFLPAFLSAFLPSFKPPFPVAFSTAYLSLC